MPYQCDDKYELHVEFIGKLSLLIKDSITSNLIVLGDFNTAVNTLFESELVNICNTHRLVVSDYEAYGRDSRQFMMHISLSVLIICYVVKIFRALRAKWIQ